MKYWILQDRNFALGNFVNITPIIRWARQQTGAPVPVFFETDYVRDLYGNHPFIQVLRHRPTYDPIASSAIICKDNSEVDYRYAFSAVLGIPYHKQFAPFPPHRPKIAVVINGSGSERPEYVNSKNPGDHIYEHAISRLKQVGFIVHFVGSKEDFRRNTIPASKCDGRPIIGDIQQAVDMIQRADLVIANDTGLAHVAGTMNKHMLVLWKDTPNIRCQNSGEYSVYSYGPNRWIEDIDDFIEASRFSNRFR